MFGLVAKKDSSGALALVEEMHEAGHDLPYVAKQLAQYFRNAMLLKIDLKLQEYMAEEMLSDELEAISSHLGDFTEQELSRAVRIITENIQQFKKVPIPQLPLELTLVEIIHGV